jgi:hypothetical protein
MTPSETDMKRIRTLNPRELTIFRLIGEGKSDEEIAVFMHLDQAAAIQVSGQVIAKLRKKRGTFTAEDRRVVCETWQKFSTHWKINTLGGIEPRAAGEELPALMPPVLNLSPYEYPNPDAPFAATVMPEETLNEHRPKASTVEEFTEALAKAFDTLCTSPSMAMAAAECKIEVYTMRWYAADIFKRLQLNTFKGPGRMALLRAIHEEWNKRGRKCRKRTKGRPTIALASRPTNSCQEDA